MTQPTAHLKGLLITALGVVILSPDALLIRLLDLDVWTLVFWRGLGIACIVGALACYRQKAAPSKVVRNLGRRGLLLSMSMALGIPLFVAGVSHTDAANVLVIIAASPLFAGLFSWLLMRERPTAATLLAIFAGITGVVVTASGSIGGPDFFGNLAAVGCAMLLGMNFTLLRQMRQRDMTGAYALGGAWMVLIGIILAPGLTVEVEKLPYLIILCGFVQPVSFTLIMIGPRYLPAAEASLIMLLETALGPLWVWFFLAEIPSVQAFIGGAIILSTIAAHSLIRLRQQTPNRSAP